VTHTGAAPSHGAELRQACAHPAGLITAPTALVHCCGLLSSTLFGRFQLVVSGPMREWAPPHVWRTQERWREQLRDVIAGRNGISCQQAGPNGPPFAKGYSSVLNLARWLPWNWYSLDGTGWCYDSSWDDMRRCVDVTDPVDWNGVTYDVDGATLDLPLTHLLALAFLACVLAMRLAYIDWEARETRRRTDAEEEHLPAGASPTPTARAWLDSGQAWPWHWSRLALTSFVASVAGLLAALLVPMPSVSLLRWLAGSQVINPWEEEDG